MTNPTGGSFGHGMTRFVHVYEGDATRTDVVTTSGYTDSGVLYAAQLAKDDIEDGIAYVKNYATWEDSVQRVAAGDNGNLITGRIIDIDHNVPTLADNGDVWTAARDGSRKGDFEEFQKGQILVVRVDGTTPILVDDNLSLKAGTTNILVKDNVNGRFEAMEAFSGSDGWIQIKVVT